MAWRLQVMEPSRKKPQGKHKARQGSGRKGVGVGRRMPLDARYTAGQKMGARPAEHGGVDNVRPMRVAQVIVGYTRAFPCCYRSAPLAAVAAPTPCLEPLTTRRSHVTTVQLCCTFRYNTEQSFYCGEMESARSRRCRQLWSSWENNASGKPSPPTCSAGGGLLCNQASPIVKGGRCRYL